jgi:hypothetical protein
MSGTIVNNVTRSSGTIAPTTGGLSWGSDVITASTATVSAGNGYWINTTSNACTVTLPSSAEIGDQVILADYARTWSTNNLIIDSNGLNFQGSPDTYTVDYSTAGQSLSIVYSDATKGWLPVSDDAVADAPVAPPTQKGIFGFGSSGGSVSMTNLVNSSGVVATDTTGVGTARASLAACGYGGDKAIFGYGSGLTSLTNLVSNSGVVATDTAGVGTARNNLAAASYGTDKGIFGYGNTGSASSLTNLVSNSGVVATDTTGVGTARQYPAAASYGSTGQAIFGYGITTNVTNLVSNVGVVATDTTGVGTARRGIAATGYGSTGQAIFAYGKAGASYVSTSNLVSNLGVVSSDVSGVGTARGALAACVYGGDKAIFAYGGSGGYSSMSNLVSNLGVIASDVTGVGTNRQSLAAAAYSTSA